MEKTKEDYTIFLKVNLFSEPMDIQRITDIKKTQFQNESAGVVVKTNTR